MSTELAIAPRSGTVPANEWLLMAKQAEYLAQSDIIPVAYRRKPANIVVAALSGRKHGWDALTSMRNGHVIEGVWGIKPEAALGLVRAAGHRVDIELIEDGPVVERGAVITAYRNDEAPFVSRFTVAMAVEKGLVQLKDGKTWARSSQGKRLPWEQYPVDMCMWRAVGRACRAKYSDITLGVYSVEELGAQLDWDGEVIEAEEVSHVPATPAALSESVIGQFTAACATEGLDTAAVLGRAFPDGIPDPLTDEHLPRMRDAFKAMIYERAGEITEAEIIEQANSVRDENPEVSQVRTIEPESERPATRAQVGKIKGEYERLEQHDREKQLIYTADIVGRAVTTHNHLTVSEADRLIEHLVGLEPAR